MKEVKNVVVSTEVDGQKKESPPFTLYLFESPAEYGRWAKENSIHGKGTEELTQNDCIMKAVNDYESRRQQGIQRNKLRGSSATGARAVSSAISEALKSGDVPFHTLVKSLQASGVTITPEIQALLEQAEQEDDEEEDETEDGG